MPRELLCPLDVTMASAPDVRAYLDVRMSPTTPVPEIVLDVELDNAIGNAARPRSGGSSVAYGGLKAAHQDFGWDITVGDRVVEARELVGAINVNLTREGFSTWSFGLPIKSDFYSVLTESPLGSLFAKKGPSTGKAAVGIAGYYLTSAGRQQVQLITNGQCHSCSRSSGPAIDVYSGGDAETRYNRVKVSLDLPQGHGLDAGAVVRRMAVLGGVPTTNIALDPGGRRIKEVQATNEEWASWSREYLQPLNRILRFDASGVLTNPLRVGCDPTAVVEATFDEHDLVLNSAGLDPKSDVPTLICLVGFEQIEREECGVRTTVQITESFGPYSPRVAAKQQGSAGTLTTLSNVAAPIEIRLVKRVIVFRTYDCDTLVIQRTITEGWKNPEVYRYQLNSSGVTSAYRQNSYIYESTAAKDDSNRAFLWSTERWCTLEDVRVEYHSDADGYRTETVTRHAQWFQRLGCLKKRSAPSDSFDTGGTAIYQTESGGSVRITGNGIPVADDQEYFYYLGNNGAPLHKGVIYPPQIYGAGGGDWKVETLTESVTADGFVTSEEIVAKQFALSEGLLFLYGDGTHAEGSSTFQEVTRERVTYSASDDDTGHVMVRERFVLGKAQPVEIEDRSGYLPAAEKRSDVEPPDSIYENDAEKAGKGIASWYEKKAIHAELTFGELLQHHHEHELIAESHWAENENELASQALRMGREASGVGARFSTAINFTIFPNTLVHVTCRDIGLDHDVELVAVNHNDPGEPGQAALTLYSGFVSVITNAAA